jgi:Leucine-rich repeat (LRR) protein
VTVESISFGRFVSLKEINLSDNFLTRVRHLRKELNGNLQGLKKLDLSGNYISDVQSLSECRFVQLDSLDLRNSNQAALFSIEKMSMTERSKTQRISRY